MEGSQPLGPPLVASPTCDSVLHDVVVDVHDVAARLESSPIGVEVKVRHRLLDADAEAHVLLGEGVDGIHKVSVIW